MYIEMYFMYIVDICKILIFILKTCVYIYMYIYIYIFYTHITYKYIPGPWLPRCLALVSVAAECLGFALPEGLQMLAILCGKSPIPEDDSRSFYCIYIYINISGPALLVSVACFLPGMFSAGGLNHRPSKLLSAVKQTKNRHNYNYSIYIYYNYVYIYNTYIIHICI